MTSAIPIESAAQPTDLRSSALDEDVWNAWIQKSIRSEREGTASRTRVVKWICIGVLAGAAVFSETSFTTADSAYQMSVRFVILLGALAVALQSLRTRQYGFTALFAAVMVLFNPLLPVFAFSGKSTILAASLIPFAASLIWMKEKLPTSASNLRSKLAV